MQQQVEPAQIIENEPLIRAGALEHGTLPRHRQLGQACMQLCVSEAPSEAMMVRLLRPTPSVSQPTYCLHSPA